MNTQPSSHTGDTLASREFGSVLLLGLFLAPLLVHFIAAIAA